MIERLKQAILDWYRGYSSLLGGVGRSKDWPRVRKEHLKNNPVCEMCGSKKSIQVHHINPFHLHPQLELEPKNLITLCGWLGHNCHLIHGHLNSFQSWNKEVKQDALRLTLKIRNRP